VLKSLSLKNYRNLNGVYTFSAGANIISAPNGSGKSNLIEAIYQLSALKIFRPHTDISQIVAENREFAEASAELDNLSLKVVVAKLQDQHNRKLWVNDKVVQPKNFRGHLITVLFAPHSVDLVSNDPASRREDLDDYIGQTEPSYADLISKLEKIIKHRNALLKHIQNFSEAEAQLEIWDQDLVITASLVVQKRLQILSNLNIETTKIAKELFPGRKFDINYSDTASNCDWDAATAMNLFDLAAYRSRLNEELIRLRKKDIAIGITTVGPHRDDWDLKLDNDSLRFLGSRGQQRLGVLVYKLAQINLVKVSKQEVILLLDDILSELDMQRREFVAQLLIKHDYFFILTAVGEMELPDILRTAHRIELS